MVVGRRSWLVAAFAAVIGFPVAAAPSHAGPAGEFALPAAGPLTPADLLKIAARRLAAERSGNAAFDPDEPSLVGRRFVVVQEFAGPGAEGGPRWSYDSLTHVMTLQLDLGREQVMLGEGGLRQVDGLVLTDTSKNLRTGLAENASGAWSQPAPYPGADVLLGVEGDATPFGAGPDPILAVRLRLPEPPTAGTRLRIYAAVSGEIAPLSARSVSACGPWQDGPIAAAGRSCLIGAAFDSVEFRTFDGKVLLRWTRTGSKNAAEIFPPPDTNASAAKRWQREPTGDDFAAFYPQRAMEQRLSGEVLMQCFVNPDESLNCSVAGEEPYGYGFGAAAIKISQRFLMQPPSKGGLPVGAMIMIPIRFQAPN